MMCLVSRENSVIAQINFRTEDRHFVPLFPEHHLTPSLSPTPWRRGRRNYALVNEDVVGAENGRHFLAQCQLFSSLDSSSSKLQI